MASDPLALVRSELGARIAALRFGSGRLSQLDLHGRMEAIRSIADAHGLAALEGVARSSAQRALLPGHRIAAPACLDHMAAALDSRSSADCTTILAALAVRLH
jgi:hypothetical protein